MGTEAEAAYDATTVAINGATGGVPGLGGRGVRRVTIGMCHGTFLRGK